MRQAERKKGKDKIAITLMLCFCVIALTSIFAIRSNINKINGSSPDLPVSDKTPAAETEDRIPEKAEEPSDDVSVPVPTVDSQQKPAPEYRFQCPVDEAGATVSNEFSMDALIYSVTLDQYMTHSGVDIETDADAQVLAMADGTVTAVYHDDRYGNTVEINHGDQYTAVYSNLSDAGMVETGDDVTAGQIIGGVGTTGLFESLEPAHLHLELQYQGSLVDPMEYIDFR
ncbi:MAG: M23 family metallopeptidase [Firmicutes bacterium]|nr:M23 family metallopeptidase [Bacillota bacterium]